MRNGMTVPGQVDTILGKYRALVDAQMRSLLDQVQQNAQLEPLATFYGQMRYLFGWVNADFVPEQSRTGKFLRPALLLLAFQLCSKPRKTPSTWSTGRALQLADILPAAAAVELVHN